MKVRKEPREFLEISKFNVKADNVIDPRVDVLTEKVVFDHGVSLRATKNGDVVVISAKIATDVLQSLIEQCGLEIVP